MTIDQFTNMKFYHGMKVKYDGKIFPIDALDFQEMLIGITETDEEDAPIAWKRCENCELLSIAFYGKRRECKKEKQMW